MAEYLEAGADQINIAVRAPFDVGTLDSVAEAITDIGDGPRGPGDNPGRG